MANFYLPKDSDIALAARGWPGSNQWPQRFNPDPFSKLFFSPQGGKYGIDLVTGHAATAESGTPSIAYDADGPAIVGDSDIVRIGDWIDLSENYCITLKLKLSNIDPWGGVITIPRQNTGENHLAFQRWDNTNELVIFNGNDSFRINNNLLGVSDLADDNVHNICFAFDGQEITVFFDNKEIESSAKDAPDLGGPYPGIYLFSERNLNTVYGSDGRIYAVDIRPFRSKAEARELSRDIYYGARPANDTPYLITVPDAGGAPTLSNATASSIGQTTATVGCTVTF